MTPGMLVRCKLTRRHYVVLDWCRMTGRVETVAVENGARKVFATIDLRMAAA